MSSQKGGLWIVLVAAAIAVVGYRYSVFKEPAPIAKPKLALVTGGSGAYWQTIAKGAKAAANDLGVEIVVQMPEAAEDLEAQAKILQGLKGKAFNGLAISPVSAESQTRVIDRLSEGLFVVTLDSDAPLSARLSYVGASNFAAGQKSGQLIMEALPNGGKIAVLMANMSKDNLLERKSGFEDVVLHLDATSDESDGTTPAEYEIVGYNVDDGDDERCKEQIREVLKEHNDLAGFVGLNARHGPILMSVLQDERLIDDMKVVTFDTPKETLDGIEAGHIVATVAQDPYQYGYEAVRLLTSYCERAAEGLPPPGLQSTTNIATKVVTRENVDEYRKLVETRKK